MNTSDRIKAVGATLVVGSLLAIALAATAQAGPGAPGMQPQVVKTVQARGEAMNRHYKLGSYSSAAVVRRAEERRGQAMNVYYGLGRDVGSGTSSGFDRTNVLIGSGALLIVAMVAGGLTVLLRRRTFGDPLSPSTP
jgi:hypothetical protein